MTAHIRFFPVGNGDMTLIQLESGRSLLADINIRAAADDPDDEAPDVALMLRDQLARDSEGRLYVDAFLLSHPDEDHCRGLREHFHLGPPDDWSEASDKILIREMWSSPVVFRRASKNHTLCADAKAFNREAKRRVALFRSDSGSVSDGDRVLIMGRDENGKTDDLEAILVPAGSEFSTTAGRHDHSLRARLLGPLPPADNESDEELLAKNRSSVILHLTLAGDAQTEACQFLLGGDAEVAIWERLWDEVPREWLTYDVLLTPHHCSWHSLSYDSWSELGENAELCQEARNALAQAKAGALLVASSKTIEDGDSDPPCVRAEREYKAIAKSELGRFECVGDRVELLVVEVGADGPRLESARLQPVYAVAGAVGHQALGHG